MKIKWLLTRAIDGRMILRGAFQSIGISKINWNLPRWEHQKKHINTQNTESWTWCLNHVYIYIYYIWLNHVQWKISLFETVQSQEDHQILPPSTATDAASGSGSTLMSLQQLTAALEDFLARSARSAEALLWPCHGCEFFSQNTGNIWKNWLLFHWGNKSHEKWWVNQEICDFSSVRLVNLPNLKTT